LAGVNGGKEKVGGSWEADGEMAARALQRGLVGTDEKNCRRVGECESKAWDAGKKKGGKRRSGM